MQLGCVETWSVWKLSSALRAAHGRTISEGHMICEESKNSVELLAVKHLHKDFWYDGNGFIHVGN